MARIPKANTFVGQIDPILFHHRSWDIGRSVIVGGSTEKKKEGFLIYIFSLTNVDPSLVVQILSNTL